MRTVGTFAYIVLANACPRTIVTDVVVIGGGAPRRIRHRCVLRVDLNKDGGSGGEGKKPWSCMTALLFELVAPIGLLDLLTACKCLPTYPLVQGVQTFVETPQRPCLLCPLRRSASLPSMSTPPPARASCLCRPRPMQAATPRGSTREVAEKYEHLMVPGYSDWPSPEDTPDDLSMPFRGFGDKYQIQDVVPTIWRITGSVAATSLIY